MKCSQRRHHHKTPHNPVHDQLPSRSVNAAPNACQESLEMQTKHIKCAAMQLLHVHYVPGPEGVMKPPAISTHSGMQLPSLPSTSTISVSHLHLHPTPFSFSVSHFAQYSYSSRQLLQSFSRAGVPYVGFSRGSLRGP